MSVIDRPKWPLARARAVVADTPARRRAFANRTVLVTGSSRGIGAAVATRLAGQGATVLVHGRAGGELERLAEALGATALAVDLRSPGAAELLADKAVAVAGRVDTVVHCAGVGHYGDLADMSARQLDDLLDVNLRAPLQLSRLLLPEMVRVGTGHLCFVSSIAGLTGVAHEAAYSAVKAGLIGLAQALRLELDGTGVTVSTVCPAAVDTDFFAGRGAGYERRIPGMWSADRVAEQVVGAIEHGNDWRVLPRWLTLAPTVRLLAPQLYDKLAARFG